jgi:hypothetical protein
VRPVGSLDRLAETAARRVLKLRALSEDATPVRPTQWSAENQRVVAYVVIEAANLWQGYCRSFYLSTAMRARDASGKRVSLHHGPIHTPNEALTIAVHTMDVRKRNRSGPWSPADEPDWPNTGHLRKVLDGIGAGNLPEVDRALNLLPGALADLRTMRNYFGHKAETSAKKAQNLPRKYGITRPLDPVAFLFTAAPTRNRFPISEPVLLRWLDALYRTIRLTVDPAP